MTIECPICFEVMDEQEKLQLPCFPSHVYHKKCIADFAIIAATPKCPACQKPFDRGLLSLSFPILGLLKSAINISIGGLGVGVAVCITVDMMYAASLSLICSVIISAVCGLRHPKFEIVLVGLALIVPHFSIVRACIICAQWILLGLSHKVSQYFSEIPGAVSQKSLVFVYGNSAENVSMIMAIFSLVVGFVFMIPVVLSVDAIVIQMLSSLTRGWENDVSCAQE